MRASPTPLRRRVALPRSRLCHGVTARTGACRPPRAPSAARPIEHAGTSRGPVFFGSGCGPPARPPDAASPTLHRRRCIPGAASSNKLARSLSGFTPLGARGPSAPPPPTDLRHSRGRGDVEERGTPCDRRSPWSVACRAHESPSALLRSAFATASRAQKGEDTPPRGYDPANPAQGKCRKTRCTQRIETTTGFTLAGTPDWF